MAGGDPPVCAAAAMAMAIPTTTAADFPFLSVFKDGQLVEFLCLHGLDYILLGRHTNCDLVVAHPSVSRHHLEIQVLHASRELLLTDLDSVHGTWVNGNKASPLAPVTVREGDSIKLGASSRTYTVKWLPYPPQHSTSSEEHSDNSDSPLESIDSKEQHMTAPESINSKALYMAAGDMTAPESTESKALHMAAGDNLQPACSTKSDDSCLGEHTAEEGAASQEVEVAGGADSQEVEVAGGSGSTAETYIDKVVVESASDVDACIDNVNSSLHGLDSQQNKSEQGYLQASSNLHGDLQFSTEPDNKIMPENTVEGVGSAVEASFEGDSGADLWMQDFQEVKHLNTQESQEANPASSKLWLRRRKSNPPARLLTCTLPSAPVPLPTQGFVENSNSAVPSAPPLPLRYLINSAVPSAPPLPLHDTTNAIFAPNHHYQHLSSKVLTTFIEETRNRITKSSANDQQGKLSDELGIDDVKENNHPSLVYQQERSAEIAPLSLCIEPSGKAADVEDYVSDKENQSPVFGHGQKVSEATISKAGASEQSCSAATEASRRPFQSLFLTAKSGYIPSSPSPRNVSGEENSVTQMRLQRRPSPVVQNLDLMLRKLKGLARSEPRRVWHIVVDITCFLDSNSFKNLKLLEGIREVRLIIPKIVISELDCLKGIGRTRSKALKWIESCMVKLPSWIHVQSSSENLPVAVTPPASPRLHDLYASSTYGDLMSPTNGDHVLNCALLFSTTVFSGQIALLTNNTALKIKAMAEGLVCESPSTFCESLLSPYSERFIWAGSMAHGHSWTERSCHMKNSSALTASVMSSDQSTKEAVISTVRALASKKHRAVDGLKRQCCRQAQGLKVVLT